MSAREPTDAERAAAREIVEVAERFLVRGAGHREFMQAGAYETEVAAILSRHRDERIDALEREARKRALKDAWDAAIAAMVGFGGAGDSARGAEEVAARIEVMIAAAEDPS